MITIQVRAFIAEDDQGLRGVKFGIRSRRGGIIRNVAVTNRDGYTNLVYDSSMFSFSRRRDEYNVVLLNAAGNEVERRRIRSSSLRVSFPLTVEKAHEYGFFKKKERNAGESWCTRWNNKLTKDQTTKTEEELGFSRILLDIMAGVSNPQNDAQKRVAELSGEHLTVEQLNLVSDLGRKGLEDFDNCGFSGINPINYNSDPDWDVLSKKLFADGGSGEGIINSIVSTSSSPLVNSRVKQKGRGFGVPPSLDKLCEEYFRNNTGNLTDKARKSMEEIYANSPLVLIPPKINLIEVWEKDQWLSEDTEEGMVIRFGDVNKKELLVRGRIEPDKNNQTVLATDVDLDDELCVHTKIEEENGRQAFFVDVQPGQVVTLKGAGFISISLYTNQSSPNSQAI